MSDVAATQGYIENNYLCFEKRVLDKERWRARSRCCVCVCVCVCVRVRVCCVTLHGLSVQACSDKHCTNFDADFKCE